MIADYLTTEFTTFRASWKRDEDGNKYSDESSIGVFMGHIQQASPELVQSLALSFTKAYTIWCKHDTNVKEGDTLYGCDETFLVKAIMKNAIGNNRHMELVVEQEDKLSEGS